MKYFGFILLIFGCILWRDIRTQSVRRLEHFQDEKLVQSLQDDLQPIQLDADHVEDVSLVEKQPDSLDMRHVDWKLMIPFLMQRQQLRLCVSIYRYDQHLIEHTPCEQLLSSEPMAYYGIGNVEELPSTMCKEFSSILFDTMRHCRPGLEIFGMRCRRRV